MPQTSPMKWMALNLLTQSSILQMISFLSMTKENSNTVQALSHALPIKKLCWKW